MALARLNWIAWGLRLLPWAATLAGGSALWCLLAAYEAVPLDRAKDVINAINTQASIVVGFAGTAMAVLLALADTSVIKRLRLRNGYHHLVAHFVDTAIFGLGTSTWSNCALALDWSKPSSPERFAASIDFGLALGMVFSVALTTHYLRLMLLAKAEPEPRKAVSEEPFE